MDIKKKYYHTIMPYNGGPRQEELDEILFKLGWILKKGYVLPGKEVKRLYGNKISTASRGKDGGDPMISLTVNNQNLHSADRKFLKEHRYSLFSYGFDEYAVNEPSIAFNESIDKVYNLQVRGMFTERLVEEPISLKYMDAITLKPCVRTNKYFGPEDEKYKVYTEGYFTYTFLNNVRKLLKEYHYDVPIVSLTTGNEYIGKARVLTPQSK